MSFLTKKNRVLRTSRAQHAGIFFGVWHIFFAAASHLQRETPGGEGKRYGLNTQHAARRPIGRLVDWYCN